jgi:hypothetical protein
MPHPNIRKHDHATAAEDVWSVRDVLVGVPLLGTLYCWWTLFFGMASSALAYLCFGVSTKARRYLGPLLRPQGGGWDGTGAAASTMSSGERR